MACFGRIRHFAMTALCLAAVFQLNGCATLTSLAEGAVESMRPSVMASLDSFESAAMAIRLSNRVLQEIPITEQDEWPARLQGAVSGAGTVRMGLSLAGSALGGVTIPAEIDPETGFPRPTSALYLFLKEREKMLDALNKNEDIAYFKKQPPQVIHRELSRRTAKHAPPVYRNTLMAYGVVTANRQALLEMQQEMENRAKGFKTCNYFLYKTTEEIRDEQIIRAACPDPAFRNGDIEQKLAANIRELQEDKAKAEKEYGKLAGRVYSTAVAGADFSAAAATKISFAIINGVRALPNIKQEFSGLKGAYNMAMILPRARNIFKSLGIYKDNLGFQWTVYKTMYQQIKGTYEIREDEPTRQALQRIKAVETAMAGLEPRLKLALAGAPVHFSNKEIGELERLAAMFPADSQLEQTLIASLFASE